MSLGLILWAGSHDMSSSETEGSSYQKQKAREGVVKPSPFIKGCPEGFWLGAGSDRACGAATGYAKPHGRHPR